jgi:hypothetical protein
MLFLYIVAPAILISLLNFLFFRKRVTVKELAFQVGGIMLVMTITVFGCSAGKQSDTQVINGHVTDKKREEVHCRHSYECPPCWETEHCSGSGSSRHCWTTRHCSTCYEHKFDVDWNVFYTWGMGSDDFRVATIDRQGLQEPPRWTQFKPGDPNMHMSNYVNYVKGNSATIIRQQGFKERYKSFLPTYPTAISDYDTILDRALPIGNVSIPELAQWNKDLTALNAAIGPKKQCNIIILFTPALSEEYFYAVKEHWLGGKKNDIIVFIDTNPDGMIRWTNTLAWAKSDMFRVKMRDSILQVGKLDRPAIIKTIGENVEKHFFRKSMKEYKYLDQAIILTDNEFYWLLGISIFLAIAISVLVNLVDFESQGSDYGGYRRNF